jgi:two-component sensor histidine kinase
MSFANEASFRTFFSPRASAERMAAIKRENEQLRVVTDELGHRIKNVIAVIQSIARQTIGQASTLADFEARFAGRLGAFGRSLDLLIADDGRGARIDEVVRLELASFDVLNGEQISVCGPPLGLEPEAARSIGLALHELATNACKYGALSVPGGKVAVHWELAKRRRRLLMTWQESGGPTVTEPKRRGFGRQVIQQIPEQALAGEVTHEFLPHGVRWTLDIPATFVVGTRGEPANVCLRTRTQNAKDRHVSQ